MRLIRDLLKQTYCGTEAARIDRELDALEEHARREATTDGKAIPVALSTADGGSALSCSDNGLQWKGLLGDIAVAKPDGK